MFDGLIDSLRTWLEGIRAWLLARPEFGWLHEWAATADVSTLWAIVVGLVFLLVLVVGFWPPVKPLEEEGREAEDAAPQGR